MSKNILILGGTQMIGRDFVEYFLQNNKTDTITIANRGLTNPELFTQVNRIKIDRTFSDGCKNLNLQHFDIVIDFSCYDANQLYNVLKHIHYGKYIILTTLCTLDNNLLNDPKHWLNGYCKGKKEVEDYILSNKIRDFTIVRPCVLYGKNDYTGRFYEKDGTMYWKHNNEPVVEDKYHIHVNKFTNCLSEYIFNNLLSHNIIHIDRDGLKVIETTQVGNKNNQYILHPYESKYISIQKFAIPFKHMVIDNLLNQDIYDKICKKFPELISRTKPYKDQPNATSNYAGYIYGLSIPDLINGYDFFSSKELQAFVEKEFEIKTSKFISPSAHFHKAPSQSGFIHRDFNICSFIDPDPNDNSMRTTGGTVYTDDTISNPNSIKVMRSIALLYYLNNDDSVSSIGGGTGIYDNYDGNLIKTIEPKNNRLFIFEMSHNSYHAFIGANFGRSAMVSWFHSSPAYMIHRHWNEYKTDQRIIERWGQRDPSEYWPIENDPEYGLYFKDTLQNLIKEQ